MKECKVILAGDEMRRTIERLAYEILERHGRCERRGADLAERIKAVLDTRLGARIPLGKLDINLYRDDWTKLNTQPQINCTEIPYDLNGKDIILVDDVLFTGRTTRAALEAILDFGRPGRVELLVLVDRGHRELPIQADYVGKRVNTSSTEQVDVLVSERDELDRVVLRTKPAA
jgi:pyrimidine operon attenuation protein/uracil phosphoribosyltransferase